jgi:hypothetical protein
MLTDLPRIPVLPFQRELHSFIAIELTQADFPLNNYLAFSGKTSCDGDKKSQVVRDAGQAKKVGIEALQHLFFIGHRFV